MLKYNDLQPWVEMLIDALENRGGSSSGIPDTQVYPYAAQYREVLAQIRAKQISMYHLNCFLDDNHDKIIAITTQRYRVGKILDAIKEYFHKEFMR